MSPDSLPAQFLDGVLLLAILFVPMLLLNLSEVIEWLRDVFGPQP